MRENIIQRLGKFKISNQYFYAMKDIDEAGFDKLMGLMTHVFILEARRDVHMDSITYMGMSPEFDLVEGGDLIPEYDLDVEVIEDEDGIRYEKFKAFRRI